MFAGKLDRRIVIQAKTSTQDAYGSVSDTWASFAEVWAQYLSGAGNELFTAAQVYADTQGRFRIRYIDGITTEHRVLYNGNYYDILSVDEIGRREGLELKVKARLCP